jgi:hypothetical protein
VPQVAQLQSVILSTQARTSSEQSMSQAGSGSRQSVPVNPVLHMHVEFMHLPCLICALFWPSDNAHWSPEQAYCEQSRAVQPALQTQTAPSACCLHSPWLEQEFGHGGAGTRWGHALSSEGHVTFILTALPISPMVTVACNAVGTCFTSLFHQSHSMRDAIKPRLMRSH